LILTKSIKIVATRCQISQLKCIKFDFGWGFAPYPAGGAYSALPDPLAGGEGAKCPSPRTPLPISALLVSIFGSSQYSALQASILCPPIAVYDDSLDLETLE